MSVIDKFRRMAEGANAARLLDPARDYLTELNGFLESQIIEFEPEVRPLVKFTFGHSGKMIRPLLVWFSGWRDDSGENHRRNMIRAGAIVELIHLATLVHDDILDGADTRHATETVVARHGAHRAVLLGDALFAHALKLASRFPTPDVCRIVAHSTRQVCSGEIAQTFTRGATGQSMERYLRIIDLKTAELFSSSARLGAFLAGHPSNTVDAVDAFARQLGIAYQVYDDLADLIGDEDKAGKTLGTDLISGKQTMPVFFWLESIPEPNRQEAWTKLRASPQRNIRQELAASGAIGKTADWILQRTNTAREHLAPFPETGAGKMLPPLTQWLETALRRLCP